MLVETPFQDRDTSMRVLPVRQGCVLVEFADLGETLAMFDRLKDAPVDGIGEIIPAARTLLINFQPDVISLNLLESFLALNAGAPRQEIAGKLIEIPVVYDGEDLQEVADILNTSVDDVVQMHVESHYTVAFTGFAPGFAYLSGGDPRLMVPRRTSPRTQVPAGSVGLAGEFSGVYPKTSPGGWQLIGTTPLAMFDIDRQPATLLQPGFRVRFREIKDQKAVSVTGPTVKNAAPLQDTKAGAAIEIVSAGLSSCFQDLGRPGKASQGISRSGAADHGSMKAANRVVGNPVNAPVIEITLGGLSFQMRGRAVMAVTGAPTGVTISSGAGVEITAPHGTPVALDDGDLVSFAAPSAGLRSYLAFRGGLSVEPALGSVACDTLAQIGPAKLAAEDVIAIPPAPHHCVVGQPHIQAFAMPVASETVTLDVVLGPRTDWFTESAVASFLAQEWSVTPQSSRVGMRLQGAALERLVTAELPSEATVVGAIQVPASGQPVLFLADHPLTGGYPVIANVASHDLDRAGQIPVGTRIRFRAISSFEPRIIPGRHK